MMNDFTLSVFNMEIVPVTLSQGHLMSSSLCVFGYLLPQLSVRYNDCWSRSNNNNKLRGVFNIDWIGF